jgi:hypothetical protein
MISQLGSLSKANKVSARFQLKVMSDRMQNTKTLKNYSFAVTESEVISRGSGSDH